MQIYSPLRCEIALYEEECAEGRQHSRSHGLENGSIQGDPLTRKSRQSQKDARQTKRTGYLILTLVVL